MNLLLRMFVLLLTWRFRSRLGFYDEAVTPFRVWPTDLDANWHMNNGIYFSIMDLGRFDLVFRNGLSKLTNQKKWYPVVASQSIRYRKSLAPFESFELRTRLVGWDDRFFYIQQKFVRRNELVALAIVKGRFLGPEGGVDPSQLAIVSGLKGESPVVPQWILQWNESENKAWSEANA